MSTLQNNESRPARRGILWLAALCVLAAVLGGCASKAAGRPADGRIVVWADNTLQNRLQLLAGRFTVRDGVRVEFRFDRTARLEQAVESQNSADLLILSGEAPMKTLYKTKAVDNYNLFAFKDDGGQVYSIAKPMTGRNYRYAQRFADLVESESSAVSGSNPNL